MNAAIRVNKPMVTSTPARHSITPAATSSGGSGPGIGNGAGKPKNFDSPCSRNRSPTTIRRSASNCGCQRESQVNSIFVLRLCSLFIAFLRGVRRILGEQPARAMDHVDPVRERGGEDHDQVLQGPVLEPAGFVEAVVGDVPEIGFGL